VLAACTYTGAETVLPSKYTLMSTLVDALSRFASGLAATKIGRIKTMNAGSFIVTTRRD
jgi:hypothetical protein